MARGLQKNYDPWERCCGEDDRALLAAMPRRYRGRISGLRESHIHTHRRSVRRLMHAFARAAQTRTCARARTRACVGVCVRVRACVCACAGGSDAAVHFRLGSPVLRHCIVSCEGEACVLISGIRVRSHTTCTLRPSQVCASPSAPPTNTLLARPCMHPHTGSQYFRKNVDPNVTSRLRCVAEGVRVAGDRVDRALAYHRRQGMRHHLRRECQRFGRSPTPTLLRRRESSKLGLAGRCHVMALRGRAAGASGAGLGGAGSRGNMRCVLGRLPLRRV